MAKQKNYNSRTRDYLLANGYTHFEIVEHWNSFARKKKDLFGFADAVALAPDSIWAVQMTSKDNLSTRKKKIVCEKRDVSQAWIKAGGRILLLGWWLNKSRRYEVKSVEITNLDFVEGTESTNKEIQVMKGEYE